jgi:hypothetical protein
MDGLKEEANKTALPDSDHGEITTPITDDAVRLQLELVLQSSLFCQSRRLSRFLRFVVEQSLAGHAEELKERTLATEVFDRVPTYDSASDPIVRVAAGDLRKRLAQYYVQQAHTGQLRIMLPPGRYRPLFQWPCPSEEAGAASAEYKTTSESEHPPIPLTTPRLTSVTRKGLLLGALAFVVTIGVIAALIWGLYAATHRAERGLRSFWEPVSTDSTAILCVGNFDRELLVDLKLEERDAVARLLGGRSVVGPGNLAALTRISGILGEFGKPPSVAMVDAVSLSDLRAAPSVLIGIFDNPWAARILTGQRFQFVEQTSPEHFLWIKDAKQPSQSDWRVDRSTPLPALQRDYALITRVRSPLTGQTDFVIAGISPYGTIAASEFVTRPEYFQQFIDAAPKGWEKRDIQIVLSTDLVNSRSAPPRMIAFSLR